MTQKEKEAGDYIIPFGQCAGSPLWSVLAENPKYFDWLLGKINANQFTGREEFQRAMKMYGNSDSIQRKLRDIE